MCILCFFSVRFAVVYLFLSWASQVVLVVKNTPTNAVDVGDMGSIPGLGRSPGGGHGNPLQYSCLENTMDREALWATVHSRKDLDTTEAICTRAHLFYSTCFKEPAFHFIYNFFYFFFNLWF